MKKWVPTYAAALLTLVFAAGTLSAVIAQMDLQLRKLPIQAADGVKFHTLPTETESWSRHGPERPPMSKEILETLGTTNYLSRFYVKNETAENERPSIVDLHCAYYTGSVDTVPHVPERCFVGGGMTQTGGPWTVDIPIDMSRFVPDRTVDEDEFGPVYLGQTGSNSVRPGRRIRMPFGLDQLQLRVSAYTESSGRRTYAGYFFLANGGAIASAEGVRLLAFDLKETYAYYAKVQFTSSLVESPEELAELAGDLLSEMLPEIMLCVPDWVDVREGRVERYASEGSGNG